MDGAWNATGVLVYKLECLTSSLTNIARTTADVFSQSIRRIAWFPEKSARSATGALAKCLKCLTSTLTNIHRAWQASLSLDAMLNVVSDGHAKERDGNVSAWFPWLVSSPTSIAGNAADAFGAGTGDLMYSPTELMRSIRDAVGHSCYS